jgi:ABC-2 type transport system ATP-binding protein
MIELQHISKQYGSLHAVEDLSLHAHKGEIFGLLGPNGAGKSTTIRMIMNIIAPDSGNILFDGAPIADSIKDNIGYLPEERGLYKKSKVNDLLMYLGRLKGKNDDELASAIDMWLNQFSLQEWKHRKVEELSKGMAQKVQFISCVIHNPEILFLDEPFSGLDPVSTDFMRDTIVELAKKGTTILFSTHIMEQAEKICNRILLMNKGKSVIYGELDEIKQKLGHKSIIVEFSGDGSFIETLPQVERVIKFPKYVEITLKEHSDTNMLLTQLTSKILIRKFEIVSPSLHNIFVSQVKGEV